MVDLILIVSLVGVLAIAAVAAFMLARTTKALERAKSEILDHGIEVAALRADNDTLRPFVEVRDAKAEADRLVSEAKEQAFQGLKSIRQRCDEILADAERSAAAVRAACRIEAMRILETVNVELEARAAVPAPSFVTAFPAIDEEAPTSIEAAPVVTAAARPLDLEAELERALAEPAADEIDADGRIEPHFSGWTLVDPSDSKAAEAEDERIEVESEILNSHVVETEAVASEEVAVSDENAPAVEQAVEEATVDPESAAWRAPELAAVSVGPFESAPQDLAHVAYLPDDAPQVSDAAVEAPSFEQPAELPVEAEEVIVEISAPSVVTAGEDVAEEATAAEDTVVLDEPTVEIGQASETDEATEAEALLSEAEETSPEAVVEEERIVEASEERQAEIEVAEEAAPAQVDEDPVAEEVHEVVLPSLIEAEEVRAETEVQAGEAPEAPVEVSDASETVASEAAAEDTHVDAEPTVETVEEAMAEDALITAPLVEVEPIKVAFEGGHKIEDIAPVNMLQRIFKLTLPVSYVDIALDNDGGWPAPTPFACPYVDPDTGIASEAELVGLLPFMRREGVNRTVQSVSAGAVPGFPSGLVAFGMGPDKNHWFALDYRDDRGTERPAVVLVVFKQLWKATVVEVAPSFEAFLDGLVPSIDDQRRAG